MNTTIGTCGNCGGRVSVPSMWFGVIPPTPSCESCGSRPKNSHGPVVPMEPRQSGGTTQGFRYVTTDGTEHFAGPPTAE